VTRLALFTLESAASAAATRRFAERHAGDLALIGISPPGRATRAMWRALRRGGQGLAPYLFCQFALPSLSRAPGRSLADLARERGIPWIALTDPARTRAALSRAGVELLVCLHLDRILDAETLAVPRLGGVNLHPSLLPHHRGPIPAFHALAEGGPFGVSAHRLEPRIDAGGIWSQREVALPDGLSVAAASRLLHEAGVAVLEQALARIRAGEPPPEPPPPLPYRGWPTSAERRAAGIALLGPGDWAAARRTPAGGWR
jgi:hypothetical protein